MRLWAGGEGINFRHEAVSELDECSTSAGETTMNGKVGRLVSGPVMLGLFAALMLMVTASVPGMAKSAGEIDAGVRTTLESSFYEIRGAREAANKAVGILVFPSIVKGGFGVGGEYGEGALLVRGKTAGYYNSVSASIGFQLGLQQRSVIIMFMTQSALDQFRRTKGWKIGADASVAVITVGAGGSIDTNKLTSPVVGFVIDPKGLMYNLTLEGSKISRISR